MAVPSVNISTEIQTSLLQDINTGTAFIIATANWGPENTLQLYSGSNEVAKKFKTGAIPIAAKMFVAGGGREIKVYRFVPDDAVASSYTLQAGTTDSITLTSLYKGSYGDNIWFRVESLSSGDITATISDDYSLETFTNNGEGFSSNSDLVDAIDGTSTLVSATLDDNSTLIDEYSQTYLENGDNGAAITSSDISTVINEKFDETYNFLLIPEISSDTEQGNFAALMNNRAVNDKEYSIYVTGISKDETYSTTQARTATTSTGRLVVLAPGTFEYEDETYSGAYAACYYAGKWASIALGRSLTHKVFEIPGYVNYSSDKKNYTPSEETRLNSNGFTVINKIGNYQGIVQAVTRITDTTSPFYEQVVLKEIDYLKENLLNILNPFVGQQNTEGKRIEMNGLVNQFLDSAILDGIIEGYGTEVLVGSTPTEVIVNMDIDPIYPVNTVNVNLTI